MWVLLRYFSQSCKQDFTPPIDLNECHKKKSVTNSRQGKIEHKHLIWEHAVITTTLLFHDKTGFYQTLQPWPGVAYTSNRTKTNHHKPIIKQRSPHRSWKVWWEGKLTTHWTTLGLHQRSASLQHFLQWHQEHKE